VAVFLGLCDGGDVGAVVLDEAVELGVGGAALEPRQVAIRRRSGCCS
jgi:hypothetical protein